MRLFPLLTFCLVLALAAPSFAYTTHRTTVGPLTIYFGTPDRLAKQEKITELDTPLKLPVTLVNNGNTDLPVKLTFRTIETLAFTNIFTDMAGNMEFASFRGTIVAGGTSQLGVSVVARPGTYSAHYPVRLDAEFEHNGETLTAHIIQVIETELHMATSMPGNPLWGKIIADVSQLPLNTLPNRGGLALATLDTYRGVWNYDSPHPNPLPGGEGTTLSSVQILPVGFQGNIGICAASIMRQTMDRGGITRQSIGMHPPYRGGVGNVGVEYRVKLPDTKPISLNFYSAMRDIHPQEPPSDGVTYRVKVDGKTVYEKHNAEKTWVAHSVDLSEFAGQEILLSLISDPGPRRDTTCDQCFWGDVVLFAGDKPAVISAEEKQKMFAENLQAIISASRAGDGQNPVIPAQAGTQTNDVNPVSLDPRLRGGDGSADTPRTHVFHLDGGLVGAVTFGNHGFIDGVIGVGNAEKQVQFDGLRVWVKGQLIGESSAVGVGQAMRVSAAPSARVLPIEVGDHRAFLLLGVWQKGPALQFEIGGESTKDLIDRIEFGPATHHAPKVYFGHGYCIVEPEAFTVHADGHTLSTSHVGMDFDNGLSVLQATSFPIDSFIVDPAARRYTLSVHPGSMITLLPGTEGALDCAIRFRPLHVAKPAPGVATKAGRFVFDIWGWRFSEHHELIEHAAKYGLTDSMLIVHNWQHYGYDVRLPDIFPPNPSLGTLEEMQKTLELCNSLGILYGVHDNYIDIYPDADGYNFDETTFTPAGQPRKAWNNYSIEAQSYQFRPDRIQPFLERNLDLIVPELPMSAYFVDVFSSLLPMDYYDREGNFYSRAETHRHWAKAFDTIRNRLTESNKHFPSAVTVSESGLDSLIGHLDGADCNFNFISPEPGEFRLNIKCKEWSRVPWFNAVHHTKFSLHGVGYSNRYEGQRGRDIHGIESDDYIVSEILTGHSLMVDWYASRRGAVRKYWLAQDLIRHLADKEIVSVEFVEGNIQRQKITWTGDTTIWVNLDESDWMLRLRPESSSGSIILPRYGYYAQFAGKHSAIMRHGGRVVEMAGTSTFGGNQRLTTRYVNARQKGVDGLLPITPSLNSFQYLGGNQFSATFKWDVKDTIPKDLCVFVHCVERQQNWHHRPNEAVLGGAFPTVPTSEWKGQIITDNHSGKNAEGQPVMAIPDTLPAGRYYLVVGLYDANGRGQRSKLMAFNTGSDRYAVGWINVQRRDGAVSNITLEPFEWDETELYERLLPPKEPVAIPIGFKTNGGFKAEVDHEKQTMLITPLPDESAMVIALSPPFPQTVKSLKAIDASGNVLREVPFTDTVADRYPLVFTTQPGEFAYKIVW